jgi:hypothetical protein
MSSLIKEVYIDVITIKVSKEFFYLFVLELGLIGLAPLFVKVERAVSIMELILSECF